jgi:hypothetical protein
MVKNINSTKTINSIISILSFLFFLQEREKTEKNFFFVVCFFSVAMISTQQTYTQIYREKENIAIQQPNEKHNETHTTTV